METVLLWGATKGKGSGIGTVLNNHLIEREYKVIIAGRNREKLESVNENLFVSEYPIDANKYTKILENNSVKTIISCVGTGYGESLPFIEDSSINEMVQANLLVNLDIIKKSINYLKGKNGNIIILNSIAGMEAKEGSSIYAATKFALRGLVESLRTEIEPYHIGLSSVYFQNIHKIGVNPVLDSIEVAIKNKMANFDFVIN